MLIDSHCHLDFADFQIDFPAVLQRMQDNQVTKAMTISVDLATWPAVIALAEQHSCLYATVGVHPDYPDVQEPLVEDLVHRAQHEKVLAIGETGLDYYRLTGDLEWQRQRFRRHIQAARTIDKPLVVHTRSAGEDTLKLLREEQAHTVGGIIHCFTESWDFAQAALDLGFYLSFSGIVTFKNAADLRDVAQKAPLDRILIETDAPYLAPVPFRGKRNEPAYVGHVAEVIAQLRGVSLEEVAAATTANFNRLFRLQSQ